MAAPPVVRTDVLAISGGYLPAGTIYKTWMPETKLVDKKLFYVACKSDRKFRAFVGDNFEMHDMLIKERNNLVLDTMMKSGHDADPLAEQGDERSPACKRPRKLFADDIPSYGTLAINSEVSGRHSVVVLTDWYQRSKLFIEYTPTTVKLLLEKPVRDDTDVVPFIPDINFTNVKWWPDRHMLYVRYQSDDGKWRYLTRVVDRDLPHPERQAQVNRKATRLQRMFDRKKEGEGGARSSSEGAEEEGRACV